MWDTLLDASVKEAPKLITSLILLGLAWLVGQRLTVGWNLRQKQREYDLATARDFHAIYGEFFAIWKMWNYYVRDVGADQLQGASRWDMLSRACGAEAKLEATIVRLACERSLSERDVERLGRFRQLYQQLRQAIRDNQPLRWDSSDHPDYVEFKAIAPELATLIVSDHAKVSARGDQPEALKAITSNKWENRRASPPRT